jgi:hypothetical protein
MNENEVHRIDIQRIQHRDELKEAAWVVELPFSSFLELIPV